MENAVDALKIAFAVMVFTVALTLAISTFSQARETSEAVLFMNDKTNYYSWEDSENYAELDANGNIIEYKSQRIVGIEEIIPTLYRYYKENYTVIFEGIDIYNIDSGTKKWTMSLGEGINYFDLNSEISRNCPWVGTVNDIKKNLDLFLKGTSGLLSEEKSFGNTAGFVTYNGFINEHKNDKFLEELGEYSTDRNYGIQTDADGQKWLVIGNAKYKFDSTEGKVNPNKFPDAGWEENPSMGISSFINTYYPDEGDLDIGNNATTKWSEETDWEVIELAKPTIKRVIRYTLQTP